MSNGRPWSPEATATLKATHGVRALSHRHGPSGKYEGGGGGFPHGYSGDGTATVLAWTFGGALIGYVLGEALVAILRGI